MNGRVIVLTPEQDKCGLDIFYFVYTPDDFTCQELGKELQQFRRQRGLKQRDIWPIGSVNSLTGVSPLSNTVTSSGVSSNY